MKTMGLPAISSGVLPSKTSATNGARKKSTSVGRNPLRRRSTAFDLCGVCGCRLNFCVHVVSISLEFSNRDRACDTRASRQ